MFGWTFAPSPGTDGRTDCLLSGALVAGIAPGDRARWLVHLSVADAAAVGEASVRSGGAAVGLDRVGDRGTRLLVEDPTGARVAGWEAHGRAGLELMWEPGSPVWFELVSSDFAGASAFYTAVFGWTLEVLADDDDFRFSTFGSGAEAMTGIEDGARTLGGEPSEWVVYFGVDDRDAAVARVLELGGSLRSPVEDTPFGRLARLGDPAGAAFSVMQEP